MRPLNNAWFAMLESYDGRVFFNRTDDTNLTVWVRFCNWEVRWEIEKRIMEHGGVVTYAEIDTQSGAILMKVIEPKRVVAERVRERAQNDAHDKGEPCDEERCQECCAHHDRDHGICLDCEHESDPGAEIDAAMDRFEER